MSTQYEGYRHGKNSGEKNDLVLYSQGVSSSTYGQNSGKVHQPSVQPGSTQTFG